MRYPEAPRLDLVEELHGHRVADPYRWLEDPDDPRTRGWTAGAGRARRRVPRPTSRCARRFAARLGELVHAGAVGIPVWRAGRAFSTRRDPGQEHAVLRVREPDGTQRVLVDPMAIDPEGTTTLDAWSPSWEGDRLAYQLSTGGDEESRLYVLDVATGEVDRRADRPLPLLPRGLAARRRGAVLRPPAAAGPRARPGRNSSTAGSGGTGSGSDPAATTSSCTARAATRPPTSASAPAATAAGWSSPPRSAPRRATTSGSPTSPADGALRELQVGVDAQTSAWVARDGRLWLMSDRDAPRWRLAVADPADPGTWQPAAWRDVVPQQDDGVLSDVALVDGPDGDLRVLAVHSVDATDRLSVWAGGRLGPRSPTSRRSARAASRASARRPRAGRRPGSATPTTRRRRRCSRWDAGDARRARGGGAGPGRRRRCRR